MKPIFKAVNTVPQILGRNFIIKPVFIFLLLFGFFYCSNIYAQGNCPVCHGTGVCQTCRGTGVMGYRYFNHGSVQQPLGCTSCGGWNGAYYNAGGQFGTGRCRNCGGTGNIVVAGPPPPTDEEIKAVEAANKNAEAAAEAKREKEAAEKRKTKKMKNFRRIKLRY